MELNFGKVKKGEKISQQITFNNKMYESYRAGCSSCTKVKVLQEGNNLHADITFHALNNKGNYTKSVTFTFADKTTEKVVFNVEII